MVEHSPQILASKEKATTITLVYNLCLPKIVLVTIFAHVIMIIIVILLL